MTSTITARPPSGAAAFRSHFPALRRVAWFATPGVPPAAAPVAAAVRGALDAWSDGSFDWLRWESDAEASRGLFAALVGTDASQVALHASLAEAAATVAGSVAGSVRPGDIVVPAREFRSNLFPWQRLESEGFRLRLIELERPADWTSAILDAITRRTRLVALSEVQSSTGVRADLPALIARCESVGALLFLNATQSLGALAPEPWLRRVDFVAAHGYKWMLAPRGAAWLAIRRDRLAAMRPLAANWKSVDEPYAALYGSCASFSPRASRLDASLAWLSWVGARAALELLAEQDARAMHDHCVQLASELRRGLRARALEPLAEDRPSQIVALPCSDAATVVQSLAAAGVVSSARDGYLRLGCHFFNDRDDVERAVAAIADAVSPVPRGAFTITPHLDIS